MRKLLLLLAVAFLSGLPAHAEDDDFGIIDATPKTVEEETVRFPLCATRAVTGKRMAAFKAIGAVASELADGNTGYMMMDSEGSWLFAIEVKNQDVGCIIAIGDKWKKAG